MTLPSKLNQSPGSVQW